MVNLLAALRCTARLPGPEGSAANDVALVVSPASALAAEPAGYAGKAQKVKVEGVDSLRIPLGCVLYDQPRHVLLKLADGSPAFTVALALAGRAESVASVASGGARAASDQEEGLIERQCLRLAAVDALGVLTRGNGATAAVESVIAAIAASSESSDDSVKGLQDTLQEQVLLRASGVL